MKTPIFKRIMKSLMGLLLLAGVSSCANQTEPALEEAGDMLMVFNIKPVATTLTPQNGVVETIKSLRIIIIADERFIEMNEVINLQQASYPAGDFDYVFTRRSPLGKKKIYFIANEESFGPITLNHPENLPTDLPTTTLSALLDYYATDGLPEDGYSLDSEPETFWQGASLDLALNSVYFDNDYDSNVDGGKLYLPYSSYYEVELKKTATPANDQANNRVEMPMYLVPVATKVYFEFINHRKNDVVINQLSIGGIASQNFVQAQLDPKEKTKKKGSKSIYWVDWLADISSASQGYPDSDDNNAFNNLNGWIDLFDLPQNAYGEVTSDSGDTAPGTGDGTNDGDGETTVEIPGWLDFGYSSAAPLVVPEYSEAGGPGNRKIGPFYMPESNFRTYQDVFENGNIVNKFVQSYFLTMDIEADPVTHKKPKFDNVLIGNLKSMFRNTCVHIKIEMRDWDDNGAYAEIQPWNTYQMNGFVTEENPQP